MFIECRLTIKDIENYAEMLFTKNTGKGTAQKITNSNIVLVKRNLNIKLKGVAVLTTNLELVIYYPIVEVQPSILNFGNVWVGNSSKAYFTIYNYSRKFYLFI